MHTSWIMNTPVGETEYTYGTEEKLEPDWCHNSIMEVGLITSEYKSISGRVSHIRV